MKIKIEIDAESDAGFDLAQDVQTILEKILPFMLDNVKVRVLVDGLPY